MNAVQGITIEKDERGCERFVRIDLSKHAQALNPFLVQLGVSRYPEGWEDGLTSAEFLEEAKKMLRKKWLIR